MMTTLELLEQGLARVKTGWTTGQLTKITEGVIEVCALGGLIPQDDYLREPDLLMNDGTAYTCLSVGARCTAVEELCLAIQRVYPSISWDEEEFRKSYIKMNKAGNEEYPMEDIDNSAHRSRVIDFNDYYRRRCTTQADIIAVYEDAIRAVKAAQTAEVFARETDLATSGD